MKDNYALIPDLLLIDILSALRRVDVSTYSRTNVICVGNNAMNVRTLSPRRVTTSERLR